MMNENTKEKTKKSVWEIATATERVTKKIMLFNSSIKTMLQSELFEKYDYEMLFLDIATTFKNTSKIIDEVLEDYEAFEARED